MFIIENILHEKLNIQISFHYYSFFHLTTPDNTIDMNIKPVLDIKARLGEGPIWNHELKQLYWIDIEGRQLHVYTPEADSLRSYATQERIGTVVPMEGGDALVALQNGIHSIDLASGELTLLVNPLDTLPDIRFNDGKCDPAGRFWVGTMHLEARKGAASLYVMEHDHSIRKVLDDITISNGILWSPDHTNMYYIDTPTRQVRAFEYDIATGEISSPKIAITVPEELGMPDGMTIDEEGMLWIGLWGGSAVARFNPETGEFIQKIEVPALNVTACAFGGDNLETLYITTASIGMNEEEQEKYPLAGRLFAVRPGVKGVTADFYKDKAK